MKKWFLKNKDQIIILVGTSLFVLFVYKFCEIIFRSISGNFSSYLLKLINIRISIPIFYIILFIIIIIIIYKIYNYIKFKNRKLKIIKATYGTPGNVVDITNELNNAIMDNKLKIVLSNNIAGDPHVGVIKDGLIIYTYEGKESKKEYKENNTIELP